jgi:MoaD family protein
VKVLLFAALRDLAGTSSLEVEGPPPDVGALLDRLGEAYGQEFVRIMAAGSVVVNGQTASRDRPLRPGDEVALLPPVSGGAAAMLPGPGRGPGPPGPREGALA